MLATFAKSEAQKGALVAPDIRSGNYLELRAPATTLVGNRLQNSPETTNSWIVKVDRLFITVYNVEN